MLLSKSRTSGHAVVQHIYTGVSGARIVERNRQEAIYKAAFPAGGAYSPNAAPAAPPPEQNEGVIRQRNLPCRIAERSLNTESTTGPGGRSPAEEEAFSQCLVTGTEIA